jgi:hypothetical protein
VRNKWTLGDEIGEGEYAECDDDDDDDKAIKNIYC